MECRYCGERISDHATLCRHCSSYQARWKNWVPHIGGAIALITLLASAGVFIISATTSVFENLTWQDEVVVIALDSSKEIVVWNVGDGDVFLESYRIESTEAAFHQAGPIGAVLEKGQFSNVSVGSPVSGVAVGGVDDATWVRVRRGEVDGTTPILYDEDHVHLREMRKHMGGSLRTFRGTAEVSFISARTSNRSVVALPVVGVVLLAQDVPPN